MPMVTLIILNYRYVVRSTTNPPRARRLGKVYELVKTTVKSAENTALGINLYVWPAHEPYDRMTHVELEAHVEDVCGLRWQLARHRTSVFYKIPHKTHTHTPERQTRGLL
jgi:hypothetical protein